MVDSTLEIPHKGYKNETTTDDERMMNENKMKNDDKTLKTNMNREQTNAP